MHGSVSKLAGAVRALLGIGALAYLTGLIIAAGPLDKSGPLYARAATIYGLPRIGEESWWRQDVFLVRDDDHGVRVVNPDTVSMDEVLDYATHAPEDLLVAFCGRSRTVEGPVAVTARVHRWGPITRIERPFAAEIHLGGPNANWSDEQIEQGKALAAAEFAEFPGARVWGVKADEINSPSGARRTEIIWGGWVHHAVLLGAIVALASALPVYWRVSHRALDFRGRRVRRGLCGRCGYDLTRVSADQCPECGEPRPYPPSPPEVASGPQRTS